jgi:hypothetical protein
MSTALPELPVIRTLGGCGGTLLSRLFAALPGVVLLSETNPRSASLFGGHLNPLKQLRAWRPELLDDIADFDQAEIGYPPLFGELLQTLVATAHHYDRRLIVRDFSYVDYIGVPFVWPIPYDSSLDSALENRFTPRSLYLVRHPAAQLASLWGHRVLQRALSAERFVYGCSAFLQVRRAAPLFRYEELTDSPEKVFRAMCEALGIDFDPDALKHFAQITAVTGHVGRAAETQISRGAPSAGAARARAELEQVSGYPALLDALGYTA